MKSKRTFKRSNRFYDAAAVVWGFAEATFFFVIPDIFTSYRALTSWRIGLRACAGVLVGALIGGSLMYAFASRQPEAALRFVDAIPTVTDASIQSARDSYRSQGAFAILYGPLETVPYKIYTVMAPQQRIGYLEFIVISALARMARFVVITAITAAISYSLRSRLSLRNRQLILTACWIIVYVIYFMNHWL